MPDYYRSHTGQPNPELRPEFFMDSVQDEAASAEAGRPVYRDVESVKVIVPGITATVVVQRVDRRHVERWKEEYQAWKQGLEAPISGTPIEAWPLLSKTQVLELRGRNIRTVEEIAHLNETAVVALGMGGRQLQRHARAYLDDAEHEAMRTSLEALADSQAMRITSLENEVRELSRHLAILSEENRQFAEQDHLRRFSAAGVTTPPPNFAGALAGGTDARMLGRHAAPAPGAFSNLAEKTVGGGRHASDRWDRPGDGAVEAAAAEAAGDREERRAEIARQLAADGVAGAENEQTAERPAPPWGYGNQHATQAEAPGP